MSSYPRPRMRVRMNGIEYDAANRAFRAAGCFEYQELRKQLRAAGFVEFTIDSCDYRIELVGETESPVG